MAYKIEPPIYAKEWEGKAYQKNTPKNRREKSSS